MGKIFESHNYTNFGHVLLRINFTVYLVIETTQPLSLISIPYNYDNKITVKT